MEQIIKRWKHTIKCIEWICFKVFLDNIDDYVLFSSLQDAILYIDLILPEKNNTSISDAIYLLDVLKDYSTDSENVFWEKVVLYKDVDRCIKNIFLTKWIDAK